MRVAAVVVLVFVTLFVPRPLPVRAQAPNIFTFHNAFWPNLHHFLYVLGRARRGSSDAARRAVVQAPKDAEAIARATEAERQAWDKAVETYRRGLSTKNAIFDEDLLVVSREMARAADTPTLEGRAIDPSVRTALEGAAPVYARIWWPKHRAANQAHIDAVTALLKTHGSEIRDRITRAYGQPWPAEGQPIQVSAYTNWSGAYSVRGGLIMMSSLDEGNAGTFALETVFHEAMHQWDDEMQSILEDEAKRQGTRAPGDLTHAMIFYTAGEVTRSVVPGHVPYAEANEMWTRRPFGPFRPALDRVWRPWLEGKTTRADAIAALVKNAERR